MLGISRIAGGGEGYYLEAVAKGVDEYYRGVGEAPGWWAGTAAEVHLGLIGEVRSEDLRAVWSGLDPVSGDQLGRFMNRQVGGFDLCWRAPKSVSLLFAFGSPELSAAVRVAHDAAVAQAFGYLEANAAGTRTGHAGARMAPVDGFVAAMFRHRTSRAGDPHLHTHVLVANLVRASDGQWRTLDGRLLFHHAKTAGYLYQAHLRYELSLRLGVEWGPVEKGTADLAGIDREVIWAFSQRRQQIVEHLDQVGFRSARAAQIATLETRPDKTNADLETIRATWDAKAAEIGFEPSTLDDLVGGRRLGGVEHSEARRLFDHLAGPEGLTKMTSTFDRRHVIQAISEGLPAGAQASLVEHLADVFLTRPDVVALGAGVNLTGATCYSTLELLRLEDRLTRSAMARHCVEIRSSPAARERQVVETAVVAGAIVEAAIAARPTLSDEQIDMIWKLCRAGDGVAVVAAAAGTGKTYALDTTRVAWQADGYRVIGAALAAKAARELETAAGIPSCTLAKLATDLAEGRVKLGPDTIVVIDEAGMAGTRRLAPILDAAEQAGAKVVLVGDPRQLPEIEAGGMLNALTRMLLPITLEQNRRQVEPWERSALIDLRSGDVNRALDCYEQHGRLVTGASSFSVHSMMAFDWWAARLAGEKVLMLAVRHSDVDDLNARARAFMADEGIVNGPVLEVDERPFQAGDEIICLRNDYRLGVRNGDRATVERVDPEGRTMRVRLEDQVRTLPTQYLDAGHIDHAYATTIHKAQGATVDRCLILGTDDLYREAGYVALSRGRTANTLYVAGARAVENDLSHAPQHDATDPMGLVRRALHQESSNHLATEQAVPGEDIGLGDHKRLLTTLESLDGVPAPETVHEIGLGL